MKEFVFVILKILNERQKRGVDFVKIMMQTILK
jgi:hypothetical protein